MFLTKIWASLLALLAAACLAGMFLLSLGTPGGFSGADRAAIRAVAEAGTAALRAEIESSPVQRAPSLLTDARLKKALDRPPQDPKKPVDIDNPPLEQTLADVAEENLLGDHPQMTVGIIDDENKVVAANGIAENLLEEAVSTTAFEAVAPETEALFSATLGGQLHVVKVSRAEERGRRLLAIQALPTGAGSLLRRVLGTQNPAGLVRNGKMLGDIIGDLQVGPQIEELASAHGEDAPEAGASDVFRVGKGLNARIGAVGRVPGPAGTGKSGAMLVVLSRNTAAAGQRDVAEALRIAVDQGQLGQLNWPLLAAIAIIGIGLAWYLPSLEMVNPLRRLAGELRGVAEGQQHQVFHDRYAGVVGEVAQASVAAQEAIHAAYLSDELEELERAEGGDDEDVEEDDEPEPRRSPTSRSRRTGSRAHRSRDRSSAREPIPESKPEPAAPPPGAIELPGDDGPHEVERHSHRTSDDETTQPREAPAPPDDEVSAGDSGLAAALGRATSKPSRPKGPPPAPGARPPPPPPGGARLPVNPREAYYQEIYEEFVQTKLACGENTDGFTFEKFATKLRRNTDQLLKKPGVSDVQFTVYIKDGKAALKAKVVKG